MFLDLVRRRRSIRKFQPKPIEGETIDLLVEALLRAPTSMGKQSWEFVLVTERGLLEKLSLAKPHGAGFLKDAQLGVVVCADPQTSDVWIEDASVATSFAHLAAASLGLGSCWIQIRERPHDASKSAEAYITALLGIPAHLRVLSIVAAGYPAEQKAGRDAGSLAYDKVKFNRYEASYRRQS